MDGNAMIEWIVALLVLVGTAMSLISSLGLLRLPDVYNRAHASTKSATLGILSILLGGFIYFLFTHGVSSIRLLLGIVFVFFTAPLAGHLIIRSAHRYGSPLAPISVQDDLKKLHSKEAMEEEMVRPVEAES
ncbi:monovalent cation/H(+) antiporter subunit G [Paenibacillus camelliae]|uniref:monovalent cation/H(+) antiporter subunit G n=1 Tax=Paenibacillus camelliae TaxID=512410 RepID=UPI00203AA060|nr:monovalent cation/H(+) antiporter subunit G [Paenibacillus camelliae]